MQQPTAAAPALPKQHLDYIEHDDGSLTAVMTVTFPNGHVERFETKVTPEEAEEVSGGYVGQEIVLIGPDEVGFGFLKKFVKKVGKVAKSVAQSKIFKLAATGLAVVGPALGPFAPIAMAASAGMGIASKLAGAATAAASGAKAVAQAITKEAHLDAKALTSTAAGAASLMRAANAKRVAADNIDSRKVTQRPKLTAAPRAAPRPAARPAAVAKRAPAPKPAAAKPVATPVVSSSADLLARARAGRVRSNKPGGITDAQLLAAHKSGRIFWVS
ncbi:MAG TPA: hypothetical protein VFN67_36330 [Polyangiales bacterium]|nr:hypothetical protein [Polyangiales bacterium]